MYPLPIVTEQARCCGYLSPDDWTNTVYYGNSSGRYPASCLCSNQTSSLCVLQSAQTIWAQVCVRPGAPSTHSLMTPPTCSLPQGCNTTLPGYLRGELVLLGGIGIAFGVIEVVQWGSVYIFNPPPPPPPPNR